MVLMSALKYHRIIHLHNDVVDGDVNKLHEKPDEAHNCESYRCGHGDLLELWEGNIQRHCQFERKNKTFLPIHSDHHIVVVVQWILLQAVDSPPGRPTFPVRLSTSLHQTDGVLHEHPTGLHELHYLVHLGSDFARVSG